MSGSKIRVLFHGPVEEALQIENALADGHGESPGFLHSQSITQSIQILRQLEIDVLLFRVKADSRHNLSAFGQVRRERAAVPIIAVCDESSEAEASCTLEHGAQDVLRIEVLTAEVLHRTIHHALDQIAVAKELASCHELLAMKNRRLQQMYESAHQFIETLARKVSEPIELVQQHTKLLRDGSAGSISKRQQDLLETISQQAASMTQSVDEMLYTSRLETGLVKAQRGPYELPMMANKLADQFAHSQVVDDLPRCFCDGDMIERAIYVLAHNMAATVGENDAIQMYATREGLSAVIRIACTENEVRDEVPDTGVSVADDLIQRNFGMLYWDSDLAAWTIELPVFEPESIWKHYSQHIEGLNNQRHEVSLILIETNSNRLADQHQLEKTLHDILRSHDLVLSVDENAWLCAANVSRIETDTMIRRIEHQLSRQQQLGGPMRGLRTRLLGTWRLPAQQSKLKDAFLRRCAVRALPELPRPSMRLETNSRSDSELTTSPQ